MGEDKMSSLEEEFNAQCGIKQRQDSRSALQKLKDATLGQQQPLWVFRCAILELEKLIKEKQS